MKCRLALVVIMSLLLTGSRAVHGDVMLFDRSCNAVQHVQQQARLIQMESVKAPGTEEYRQTLAGFKAEMNTLFKRSETLEKRYNDIRNKLESELIEERQDLVDKYRESVARERPDLVERAQQGDSDADREFRNALLEALEKDLEFGAELRERIEQDRETSQIATDAFKLQVNEFHALEVKMAINRWKAPPDPASQEVLKQKTVTFVGRQGYESRLQEAVLQSRAMTDLMTVKSAIQSGLAASLESQEESGAMALRDRYDTPVPDADTNLADVPRVLATPVAREVLGKLEAGRLQTELDLIHVSQHSPADAKERGVTMRNPEKPLAKPVAETVGAALERHRIVKEGYERLSKFKEPPPPKISDSAEQAPSKVKEWAVKVATSLEKAAIRTKYVLIDDENDQENKSTGGSK